MTTIANSLEPANASFRRGGRTAAIVLVVLGVAVLVYWLSRGFRGFGVQNITERPIGAWIGIVTVLGLVLWMLREAVRSSQHVLTPAGIQRGDQLILQWPEIAVAEYARGWLRLTNRQGRRFTVSLVFASSSHAIMEAVQDHLPAEVRLRVY